MKEPNNKPEVTEARAGEKLRWQTEHAFDHCYVERPARRTVHRSPPTVQRSPPTVHQQSTDSPPQPTAVHQQPTADNRSPPTVLEPCSALAGAPLHSRWSTELDALANNCAPGIEHGLVV